MFICKYGRNPFMKKPLFKRKQRNTWRQDLKAIHLRIWKRNHGPSNDSASGNHESIQFAERNHNSGHFFICKHILQNYIYNRLKFSVLVLLLIVILSSILLSFLDGLKLYAIV